MKMYHRNIADCLWVDGTPLFLLYPRQKCTITKGIQRREKKGFQPIHVMDDDKYTKIFHFISCLLNFN